MEDIRVVALEPFDVKDAFVILAFPAVGAAPAIAAQYLHERIDLPLVGHILADSLSSIVHVEKGRATSPIRIHGGEVVCQLDRPCQKLFVVSCPIAPGEHLQRPLAAKLLETFKEAYAIVSLDSLPRDPSDNVPDVYSLAADEQSLATLQESGTPVMPRAIFTGLTAEMLSQAGGRRVACLAVEAAPDLMDGRAAAALIACVDKLIPHVKVDSEPLREEALRMEAMLAEEIEEASRARARTHATTFV